MNLKKKQKNQKPKSRTQASNFAQPASNLLDLNRRCKTVQRKRKRRERKKIMKRIDFCLIVKSAFMSIIYIYIYILCELIMQSNKNKFSNRKGFLLLLRAHLKLIMNSFAFVNVCVCVNLFHFCSKMFLLFNDSSCLFFFSLFIGRGGNPRHKTNIKILQTET